MGCLHRALGLATGTERLAKALHKTRLQRPKEKRLAEANPLIFIAIL